MGVAFVGAAARAAPTRAAVHARVGAELAHRVAHGRPVGRSSCTSAVLARVGEPSLAAHQIAFQLFVFLALVLDALAMPVR